LNPSINVATMITTRRILNPKVIYLFADIEF